MCPVMLLSTFYFSALTVFETTKAKREKDQRKRNWNMDSTDVDGYTGPWGGFVDEERVAKPDPVSIFAFLLFRCFKMVRLSGDTERNG